MSEHTATVSWPAPGAAPEFRRGRFSRVHTWRFDGGLTLTAAASPAVVPPPYTDAGAIDPEEAFIAALASCHMMSFLYLANRAGVPVTAYLDEASGILDTNAAGRQAVVQVTLRPIVTVSAAALPAASAGRALHEEAHALCFIANSVTTDIIIDPAWRV